MAKNTKPNRQLTPVQQTIIDRRNAQKKRDKRNAIILISVLSVVLVALIVTTGVFIWKAKNPATAGSSKTQTVNNVTIQTPGDLKYGIVLGKDGINKPTPDVNTISFFFSYGCPGCLQVDHNIIDSIEKEVKAGKFNLVLFPVGTHGLPWTYIAGDAAMKVSREQPEVFWTFHKNLLAYAYGIMFKDEASAQAQGNGTILANPDAIYVEVQKIARQSGVKDSIIKSFQSLDNAKADIQSHDNSWISAVQPLLKGNDPSTPMFIKNKDELIDTSKFFSVTPEENTRLKELSKSNPTEYQAQVDQITKSAYKKMIDYFGKK